MPLKLGRHREIAASTPASPGYVGVRLLLRHNSAAVFDSLNLFYCKLNTLARAR